MTDGQIRGAIDDLLKQRKSPLEGCGAYFWVLGRLHGIDGRLAVGVAAVTHWLAQEYVAKGFNTVSKIEPKWVGTPSPNWIKNVTAIMQQLGGDPNKLACPTLAVSP